MQVKAGEHSMQLENCCEPSADAISSVVNANALSCASVQMPPVVQLLLMH